MEHPQILAFTNKESICLSGNSPSLRNRKYTNCSLLSPYDRLKNTNLNEF